MLELSQSQYQITLFVIALVAVAFGQALFQITANKILPGDIGNDMSKMPVCSGA